MLRPFRLPSLLLLCAFSACSPGDDARRAMEAIQPGGPPDQLPVMQNAELPFHYPRALYDQRIQANVVLRLYVDSLGRVLPDSTQVAEPSGHPQLDSAAVTGSRELRFEPARRNGQPVSVAVLFPIFFRHPDEQPLPGDTVLGRPAADLRP